MLRVALTDNTGRKVVILGLTEENLQRLRQGKPIGLKLDDLHPSLAGDLLIHYGASEDAIAQEIFQGEVPPRTPGVTITPAKDVFRRP